MRFLLIVKATPMSERGEFPPDAAQMFADMAVFNNEMIAAGVMLDGAGLKPSSAGKRIRFEDRGKTIVTDGPFAETKEVIAGFWVLECKDMEEALSWARRAPYHVGELELRPYYEPEAFRGVASDEVIAQEQGWREEQKTMAPKAPA
jgi:hypothetical protein